MPHQLLTISHHVARITLHNPPANVLNLSVLKELERILSDVEEDPYVRTVILDRFRSLLLCRRGYQ